MSSIRRSPLDPNGRPTPVANDERRTAVSLLVRVTGPVLRALYTTAAGSEPATEGQWTFSSSRHAREALH